MIELSKVFFTFTYMFTNALFFKEKNPKSSELYIFKIYSY